MSTTGTDSIEAKGRALVAALADRRFGDAVPTFDATMRGALPEGELSRTWDGILAGAGAFRSIEASRLEKPGAHRRVVVTCVFDGVRLDAKIVYDEAGSVAGLFFAPTPAAYADPAYVERAAFDEREVMVGSGRWQLPGTLSIPKGAGPFPAVVLVHGSGPNDRDETIGVNKPFKDLANGLASRGVAVLRYDKRTKVHGAELGDLRDFTVDHETVEDAVLAVDLLRGSTGVDPKRIAVAGHSLGGQLAPRIASRCERVAAVAILAGSTRPVPDMMLEQMKHIASLRGSETSEETELMRQVAGAGERVREIQAGSATRTREVLLGAGAAYWIDLGNYDAPGVARSLGRPIFVAQGGRDYQVTRVDFDTWKKALAGKKDVTFALYPELNHAFGAGEGESSPAEYHQRAPVDVRLIDDLAAFVKRL